MKRWMLLAVCCLVLSAGAASAHGGWHDAGWDRGYGYSGYEDTIDNRFERYHRRVGEAVYRGWITPDQGGILHEELGKQERQLKSREEKNSWQGRWQDEEAWRQNTAAKAGISLERLSAILDGRTHRMGPPPYEYRDCRDWDCRDDRHDRWGRHAPYPKG